MTFPHSLRDADAGGGYLIGGDRQRDRGRLAHVSVLNLSPCQSCGIFIQRFRERDTVLFTHTENAENIPLFCLREMMIHYFSFPVF